MRRFSSKIRVCATGVLNLSLTEVEEVIVVAALDHPVILCVGEGVNVKKIVC